MEQLFFKKTSDVTVYNAQWKLTRWLAEDQVHLSRHSKRDAHRRHFSFVFCNWQVTKRLPDDTIKFNFDDIILFARSLTTTTFNVCVVSLEGRELDFVHLTIEFFFPTSTVESWSYKKMEFCPARHSQRCWHCGQPLKCTHSQWKSEIFLCSCIVLNDAVKIMRLKFLIPRSSCECNDYFDAVAWLRPIKG